MRCRVSIDGSCFDENYTLAAVAFVSTFREWRECECRHVLRGNRQTGEFTQPMHCNLHTYKQHLGQFHSDALPACMFLMMQSNSHTEDRDGRW